MLNSVPGVRLHCANLRIFSSHPCQDCEYIFNPALFLCVIVLSPSNDCEGHSHNCKHGSRSLFLRPAGAL